MKMSYVVFHHILIGHVVLSKFNIVHEGFNIALKFMYIYTKTIFFQKKKVHVYKIMMVIVGARIGQLFSDQRLSI